MALWVIVVVRTAIVRCLRVPVHDGAGLSGAPPVRHAGIKEPHRMAANAMRKKIMAGQLPESRCMCSCVSTAVQRNRQ
jgi:hypothetical protein